MFYCEKCQIKNNWPISIMKSVGKCEICESEKEICNDIPSSKLPDPKESKKGNIINMENILETAEDKARIGKKISILLSRRKSMQDKLDDLNSSQFYASADISFNYLNKLGSTSSCLINYKKKNILYSTELQYLGKDIVDKINELQGKLITNLLDNTKTHLELKIELIDKLLENLNNEKGNIRT